jgi:hypothetical protein
MVMIHAPGRLHIGGVAYVVWADPPNGGYTAQRPVAMHMKQLPENLSRKGFVPIIDKWLQVLQIRLTDCKV